MVPQCILPLLFCWLGIFLWVGCFSFLLGGWTMSLAYSACCLRRGLCCLRGSLCCLCRLSVPPCPLPSFEIAFMFLVAGSFRLWYSFGYTVIAWWIESLLLLLLILPLFWSCLSYLCNSWCWFIAVVIVSVVLDV